jgi:broad specificity phosphatase PhoE
MAPTIHCVRHAQGYHNLSIANHQLHDPLLTPYGEEQCRNLGKTFPYNKSVELVVASPIRRTIYTALIAFETVLREKNMKIIALPELQETSDLPCDTGSSVEELLKEFEGKPVDLSLVTAGWNNKRMRWAATATAIEKRGRDARQWLFARPEKEIAMVSHGL